MPTLSQLAQQGHGFAVFPEIRIFDKPDGKSIQHLIFGDFITPPKTPEGKYKKWTKSLTKPGKNKVTWINVRSRQEEGWIRLTDIQLNRTLEINFVDIGQGDGCHLVTPADEHFLIDAGEGDNMYRFLRWRFNLTKPGASLPKFTAVMSHPDQDHWKGFELLLSKPPANQPRRIVIDKMYYNGILQRTGSSIGTTVKSNGNTYLTDFIMKQKDLETVLNKAGKKSNLEKFLIGALENFPDLELETAFKKMGKENMIYKDDKLSMEILAPIPEEINNKLMLRWFDPNTKQIGKTKNGHSVVVVAQIGKMKILLGGDLNSESADYLMSSYSKQDIRKLRLQIESCTDAERPALQAKMDSLIESCKEFFRSEIAKSCHHGSSDITNEFLQTVSPIATVISSGDEEPHFHPRPDTLGAIGKYGRGTRPLIFSTELGRSSPEFLKLKLDENTPDKKKQKIVSTYGMVTVRTDGENAIISQKLEKGRSSFGMITKWHVEKIIWNEERKEFITRKEIREDIKKEDE
jgi:beta-lactamase superfamily II metal-dependent hydrolase